MIKDSGILLLDEATSNIDKETDTMIQKTIRTKLWDRTIIGIAHRILTISDYDRVVVMDNGCIAEEGHPYKLLGQRGIFAEMVENSEGKDEIIEIISKNYKNREKKMNS